MRELLRLRRILLFLLGRHDNNRLLRLLYLRLVYDDHRPLGIRDDDLLLHLHRARRRAFVHGHALCLRSAADDDLFLLRRLGLRLDGRNNDRRRFLRRDDDPLLRLFLHQRRGRLEVRRSSLSLRLLRRLLVIMLIIILWRRAIPLLRHRGRS